MIEIEETHAFERDESIIRVKCDCGWSFPITITGVERKVLGHTGISVKIAWMKEIGVAHEAGHEAERFKP